jgi:hypothetical protein
VSLHILCHTFGRGQGEVDWEGHVFFSASLISTIVDRNDESSRKVPENIIQSKKKRTVLERVTSSEREKAWYYYSSDGWIVPACSGHCDATSS